MKAHLTSGEYPLKAGQPITAACGPTKRRIPAKKEIRETTVVVRIGNLSPVVEMKNGKLVIEIFDHDPSAEELRRGGPR